ncbi:MAG: peptidylprolyl isomerase [Clostridia bacterium]|nr:peptidylprolyl isomerase [Clostridia bacterium]
MKKFLITAVASAVLLSICLSSCTVVYESAGTSDSNTTAGTTPDPIESEKPKTPVTPPAEDDLSAVVAQCSGTDITGEDFYFFLYYLCELIYKNNEAYIVNYYGGEKPDYRYTLKEQYIMSDTTWYDYMIPQTEGFIAEMCALIKASVDDGMVVTDADKARIQNDAKNYAIPAGTEYISESCRNKCLELIALNDIFYYRHLEEKNAVTDDEINAEYEKNKKNYTAVDIKYYQIPFSDDTAATDANGTTLPTKAQAQAYADRLMAAGASDEFEKIVEEIYKAHNPNYKEEDLKTILSYCKIEGQTYYEYDFLTWAFDSARKEGDVTSIESENEDAISVTVCLKPAYPDESPTASIRHILVDTEDIAKSILAEFEAGDKTEASFAALATKHTTDPGSKYTGGLYASFAEGTMVESFNDWSFDEARAAGDTGIVATDYGYHIMYYVSAGMPMYKATVQSTLVSNKKQAEYEKLVKDVKAEFIDGFIENINA